MSIGTVLYGHRYAGMEEFISQIPDNFIIRVNPGNNRDATNSVCCWEDFSELVTELHQSRKQTGDFSSYTISYLDGLYEMCVDYICQREDEEHPSVSKSKKLILWRMIREEMEAVLYQFNNLEGHKFYLSKVVMTEIENSFIKGTAMFPFTEDNWVLREIMPQITEQTLYFGIKKVKLIHPETKKTKTKDKGIILSSLRSDIFAGDLTGKLPKEINNNYETYIKEMSK